jgi:[acyl-carrier-protein] S-malonyltransferase
MAEAGRQFPGTMAAIVGLPVSVVTRLCLEATEAGHVEVANLNGPEQTVVSGTPDAVERLLDLADELGGAVLPLPVSGAFHSQLMAPILPAWQEELAAVTFRTPRLPVVANVTAAPLTTVPAIREALLRQVTGTVRWSESVDHLAALGAERVVDVGPGKVLRGLVRRIAPQLELLDPGTLLGMQGARA